MSRGEGKPKTAKRAKAEPETAAEAAAPESQAAREEILTLPILPLFETVIFPGTIQALTVGRAASLRLLEENLPLSKSLGLVLRKEPQSEDENAPEQIHDCGVVGQVIRMIRQSEEIAVVFVRGERRMRVRRVLQREPYMKAEVELLPGLTLPEGNYAEAAVRNLRESAKRLLDLLPDVPDELGGMIAGMEDPAALTDFLASHLSIKAEEKQKLLEETDVNKRVASLQKHIDNQLHIAELQSTLRENVHSEFSEAQKRAYLREQLRAIQKELGEEGSAEEQVEDIRQRLEKAGLPEKAKANAERELKRLEIIPPSSPDHSVIVSYLETLAELPWNVTSEESVDLDKAQEILDRDHYGLEKVKKRLIEYLAVRKLNPEARGPILCFLGPPGVGKTSLGQSIAEALGRKFARLSLGGVRDES